MKDELGGKIMAEATGLRPKTYSCLKNDNNETKNTIATKKCVIKSKLEFKNYKLCLEATQLENKISKLENIELM